eukprot:6213120-Pleurochrysis_carterae.AAC.2
MSHLHSSADMPGRWLTLLRPRPYVWMGLWRCARPATRLCRRADPASAYGVWSRRLALLRSDRR